MKLHHLFLSLSVLFTFASALRADVNPGQPAPDFTLTDLSGNTVNLSDYKGKFVVLEWTNPACPFVKKFYEPGEMQKLQAQAQGMDVVWLSINSTSPESSDYQDGETAKSWTKQHNVPATWLKDSDGKVGKMYGATNTPQMFVINPEGVVVYEGAIDSIRSSKSEDIAKADNFVMAALTAAREGRQVERPQTRPYGCSVKY